MTEIQTHWLNSEGARGFFLCPKPAWKLGYELAPWFKKKNQAVHIWLKKSTTAATRSQKSWLYKLTQFSKDNMRLIAGVNQGRKERESYPKWEVLYKPQLTDKEGISSHQETEHKPWDSLALKSVTPHWLCAPLGECHKLLLSIKCHCCLISLQICCN